MNKAWYLSGRMIEPVGIHVNSLREDVLLQEELDTLREKQSSGGRLPCTFQGPYGPFFFFSDLLELGNEDACPAKRKGA